MSEKPSLNLYYFNATHWDREWYRPFQYFRGMLLENVEKILWTLKNIPRYQAFVFDGQTIVLEDILEIRSDLKNTLRSEIQRGKLKIGPWYLMPDELLVSGESLIRNLLMGRQMALTFGSEPWPVCYVCDTFGHIAQLPQLCREFGLHTIVGWRGFDEQLSPYLNWEAPDGSRCKLVRLPFNGYGDFGLLRLRNDGHFDEAFLKWLSKAQEVYGNNILLNDGLDHTDIHVNAPEMLDRIRQLIPGVKIHWTDYTNLPFFSEAVPVICGEQIAPCRGISSTGIQIPHTLSSRYDLKSENDRLQHRLVLEAEPIAVYLGSRFDRNLRGMLKRAWKLCLQNQAHDSICGCSIDTVHKIMHTRTAEALQICDYIRDVLIRQDRLDLGKPEDGRPGSQDGRMTLRIFNPLPFLRREVHTLRIDFASDYFHRFAEVRSTEKINAFRLFDSSGNEIPFAVTDIQRGHNTILWGQRYEQFDSYFITAEVQLSPLGWTTICVEPSERPVRFFGSLRVGINCVENDHIQLNVNSNGTFDLLDKHSGRRFNGFNDFIIDHESGDGWGSVQPIGSGEIISSNCSQVVITEDNPLRTVFQITREYMVPEELIFSGNLYASFDAVRTSPKLKKLQITTTLIFNRCSPAVTAKITINNRIRDCRVRLRIPTGIAGRYFASQAFAVIEREPGYAKGDLTQDWREKEQLEKNFSGIVGKRDGKSGIAFLSASGLHEVSAPDSESLIVTLYRAFRRTVGTDGESDGELQQNLTFDCQYQVLDATQSEAELFRQLQFFRSVPIVHSLGGGITVFPERQSRWNVTGDLVFSCLKPSEDGVEDNMILRLVNLSRKTASSKFQLPIMGEIGQTDAAERAVIGQENAETVTLTLPAWRIGTWRISLKKQ